MEELGGLYQNSGTVRLQGRFDPVGPKELGARAAAPSRRSGFAVTRSAYWPRTQPRDSFGLKPARSKVHTSASVGAAPGARTGLRLFACGHRYRAGPSRSEAHGSDSPGIRRATCLGMIGSYSPPGHLRLAVRPPSAPYRSHHTKSQSGDGQQLDTT